MANIVNEIGANNYKAIEGYTYDSAIIYTEYIYKCCSFLRCQSVVEIGVLYGRYLSVLADLSTRSIVGYDLFRRGSDHHQTVREHFQRMYQPRRVKLVKKDSREVTYSEIKADLGEATCGVFSVDASHEFADVKNDMILANSTLSDSGIMVLDDFANPNWIGVTEAFFYCTYCVEGWSKRVIPFAYVGNKLFLCRPEYYENYINLSKKFMSLYEKELWMKNTKYLESVEEGPLKELTGWSILRIAR